MLEKNLLLNFLFFLSPSWNQLRNSGYQKLEMDLNEYLSSQNPEEAERERLNQAEMDVRYFLRAFPAFQYQKALPGIGFFFFFFFF